MPKTIAGIDAALADLGSGYGTQASVAFLKNGLLQGRLILLRTLITEATARHAQDADSAGLAAAYQVLGELQRSRAAGVVELLTYPHTGSWLARCLRRIYATQEDDIASEHVPLWADLGYLGWLAATGSIASGTEGSMRLVVRAGAVMLPRLGLAQLGSDHEHGHCDLQWTSQGALTLQWGAHQITIPSHHAQDHPAWLPLRRANPAPTPTAPTAHAIFLDDIDPFRDFDDPYIAHVLTTPPPRLTDAEAATWQQNFAKAWDILTRDYDRYLPPMRSDLRTLVPLSAKPIATGASNTSYDGYGGVYTTAPAGPYQLALTRPAEAVRTGPGLPFLRTLARRPPAHPRAAARHIRALRGHRLLAGLPPRRQPRVESGPRRVRTLAGPGAGGHRGGDRLEATHAGGRTVPRDAGRGHEPVARRRCARGRHAHRVRFVGRPPGVLARTQPAARSDRHHRTGRPLAGKVNAR
jgi:HEXXH motif-containing protein